MVKNVLILVFICYFALLFSACSFNPGRTNNVKVTIGESTVFTKGEIQRAVNTVIRKFKSFKGCDLTDLWYNQEQQEESSDTVTDIDTGKEISNDNTITLFSNFNVDASGGDGGFEPNSTCTDWSWTLIRDSQSGAWRVNDWGY